MYIYTRALYMVVMSSRKIWSLYIMVCYSLKKHMDSAYIMRLWKRLSLFIYAVLLIKAMYGFCIDYNGSQRKPEPINVTCVAYQMSIWILYTLLCFWGKLWLDEHNKLYLIKQGEAVVSVLASLGKIWSLCT